jgi:hypothetical protein
MPRKETITVYCDRCGDKESYDANMHPEIEPDGWTEISEGMTYYTDQEDISLEGEMWCKICTGEFLLWRKDKPSRAQQLNS